MRCLVLDYGPASSLREAESVEEDFWKRAGDAAHLCVECTLTYPADENALFSGLFGPRKLPRQVPLLPAL